MREYKPRRASKRWLDGDCPAGVLAIFDNPKFGDRYTVFYAEVITYEGDRHKYIGYRGMSAAPCDPQGVGLYSEMEAHAAANYRYFNSKKACKWTDLPEAVKNLVRHDLAKDTPPMKLKETE